MKKGLVAILAVAIIGALGMFVRGDKSGPQLGGVSSAQNTGSNSNSGAVAGVSTSNGSSSSPLTYKDGSYKGQAEDTPYGVVQIGVEISGGKITNVDFLQMPNDRGHTQEVTAVAGPMLKQETLQNQSGNIDFISGATSTSEGYVQSLQSALNQAA